MTLSSPVDPALCDDNVNSMAIGTVIDTIADWCPGAEVDDMPLSEELRSAISNIEDLEDVSTQLHGPHRYSRDLC